MNLRRPRLAAPPGMCDTHMHFYDTSVPSAPGGPALPGNYSVPMYRELQKRLGMSRVVVVQPNVTTKDRTAGVQTGEMVLITETGIERFHAVPRGLHVT